MAIFSERTLAAQLRTDSLNAGYYFYNGLGYGSQPLINPERLILSGGLGILQKDNCSNTLSDIDFETGTENLWLNMSHPLKAINEEGKSEFSIRFFKDILKTRDFPGYDI